MKRILVTRDSKNGIIRKYAKVDDVDYTSLSKYVWNLSMGGYARATINHNRIFMHRLLLGVDSKLLSDHINGDRLDNTRNNLRLVTSRQNIANSKKTNKNALSKYKGVTYCNNENRKKPWRAACEHNGKMIYIGRYLSEEEAALAYNRKATELWGEFAKINEVTYGNTTQN